jgi:hypothetical protein
MSERTSAKGDFKGTNSRDNWKKVTYEPASVLVTNDNTL